VTKVTIIGAGFAALTAIRRLRKADPEVEVTLIAPDAEFQYYPSLIWIPAGLRKGNDLKVRLEGFLERYRVGFHKGSVTGLEEGGRLVNTTTGKVRNDALVIASGGRFLKGLPGIEHVITLCEGVEAAESIRDQLASMERGVIAFGFGANPKEPSAMRGGPMFELLFGIDTLLRRQGRREQFRLVFFNPAQQPGKRLGEKAVKGLMREMARRGIETHLGHKIVGFEPSAVKTEGGSISADLILFMPGMTGPAWLAGHDWLPLSEGGLLRADRHCKVTDTERVYVAGDSGSYPGPDWLPKQAHMADLQAAAAVTNLLAECNGQRPWATFKAELACIIDTLDKGILVYRTEQRTIVVASKLFHWAKRAFERFYLRAYRSTAKGATGATESRFTR
jgi:sulfide:quinone oxidoreductase